MTGRTSLTIVLAAGEGTRMRSSTAKVLHQLAGQSLLAHVLKAAPEGPGSALAVVIGPDRADVAAEATRARADAAIFIQRERLGTAHAVLAARDAIARGADDLLVVFGDTPLISAATLARAARAAAEPAPPWRYSAFAPPIRPAMAGYWSRSGRLLAIREHADASAARARDRPLQCRGDGVRWPQGARDPRQHRHRPTSRASII